LLGSYPQHHLLLTHMTATGVKPAASCLPMYRHG
jgi:3-deoxy-D-manno-octulosonic-acid transferase